MGIQKPFSWWLATVLAATSAGAWAASGTVFRDYNRDGTQQGLEPGVAGVTITAYGAANQACGSTTSAALGAFSFTPATTPANCNVGQYRYELTGAASFLQLGSLGAGGAASNVRFAAGNVTGLTFSVAAAGDYCVASGALATQPNLVLPIWRIGAASTGGEAIRQFPHSRSGNVLADTTVASFANVGATYGMAYDRATRRLFAGSYARRHVGNVVSGGTSRVDRIYAVPRPTDSTWGAPLVYAEGFVSGSDPRVDATDYINDPILWDQIGKIGWGDIDLSGDGESLYAVNLADRLLYRLPARATTGLPLGPNSAGVSSFTIPNPCRTLVNDNNNYSVANAELDFRPFGLGMEDGVVYVAGVCTSQSSATQTVTAPTPNGNRTRMWAWVARFDPAAGTFGASPVLSFRLDYPRNDADPDANSNSAEWQPWTSFQNQTPLRSGSQAYPMPIFADLDFDRGDMILALRDRLGDLSTVDASNPTQAGGRIRGIPGGEVLRACLQSGGGYTLESNGACNGVNGNIAGAPGTGANGARGPGTGGLGGEFYPLDHYVLNTTSFDGNPHDETSFGSVVQVPGFPQVISTAFDPFDEINSGGVVWFNNASPASNSAANYRGYEVYTGGSLTSNLSKSNGLGDLEALCDSPPIQLGNRLWNDSNGDGVQDPGEAGLSGVRVDLVDASGAQIGTTTTDPNGNYAFSLNQVASSGETGTDAVVTLSNAELYGQTVHVVIPGTDSVGVGTGPAAANAVSGTLRVSTLNANPLGSNAAERDSDGVVFDPPGAAYGPMVGGSVLLPSVIGASIHAIDFGFQPNATPLISIGNRVFYDTNNDGIRQASELGIAGVLMELLDEGNANVDNPNLAGIQNYTLVTDADGFYRFDALPARTGGQAYRVRVAASNFSGVLAGYWNSAGAVAATDDTDSGTETATPISTGVVSANVQPAISGGPVGEAVGSTPASLNGPSGSVNDDLRVDFGFYRVQIGSAVYLDANNNGLLDSGETPLGGVTVQLAKLCTGGGNAGSFEIVAQTTTTGTFTGTIPASINYLFSQQTAPSDQPGAGFPMGLSEDGVCGAGNYRYVVALIGTSLNGYSPATVLASAGLPDGTDGANRGAYLGTASDDVVSGTAGFSVQPGGSSNGETANNANATTLQPRLDFGLIEIDWGDMPDTDLGAATGPGNYVTTRAATAAAGGAQALVTSTLRLSRTAATGVPDRETSGQPNAAASGDGADENGVLTNGSGQVVVAAAVGSPISIPVGVFNNSGATATVCGYLDLNGDGVFGSGELASTTVVSSATDPVTVNLGFGNVSNTLAGNTYARFRVIRSTAGDACSPLGFGGASITNVLAGEVEDYPVLFSGVSADLSISGLTNPTCVAGESHSLSAVVSNSGATRATVNTGTFSYVVPAAYARMDFNTSLAGGAACLSGCSGSVSSISGSPGTITTQLFMPANATVTFTFQGIVRSIAGQSIANQFNVAHPSGLADANANNNSAADADSCSNPPPTTNTAICAEPGKDTVNNDAATTITAVSVVNTYYSVSTGFVGSSISAGSKCLPLDSTSVAASQGAGAPFSTFAAGDLLLVIQMQDGTYGADDDLNYGGAATDGAGNGAGFNDLANGGRYEFVQVDGPPGTQDCPAGTLPITGSGDDFGLLNAYVHAPTSTTNREVVQFVKVPQYKGLTFSGAGRIDALPWNGNRGGVAAVDVRDTLNLGASASCKIDASADGFRGGAVNAVSTGAGSATSARALPGTGSGRKGEGLAGSPDAVSTGTATVVLSAPGYVSGSARKGAPGNAGGGGNSCATAGDNNNSHKSGGGGGGNGGPGGKGGSNLRGSRLCSAAAASNGGGLGGAPLTNTASLLSLGGGGGSGGVTTANGQNGAGGVGGGIVIVRANAVIGTGDLCANGGAGVGSSASSNAGGGGGAGGSLLLFNSISGSSNFTGLRLLAGGGVGGVGNGSDSAEGGGGGGGGSGRIFISANPGVIATQTITGGAGGVGGGAGNSEDGTQPSALGLVNGTNNSLNPYNATPGAKPGFLCSSGTVPVTLSDVEPVVEGSTLVVRFGTASEAGTLGYRVHADIGADGVRSLLSATPVLAQGASLVPQRYEVRGSYAGQTQVWIEELATDGRSSLYGPYPVGQRSGERNLTATTDWPAIRSEQVAFRRAHADAVLSRGSGASAEVELRIDQDGWVRVSHENLQAIGVDWSGIAIERLGLSQGNAAVGLERLGGGDFGPGKAVAFYAQAVRGSLYTRSNVYRLRVQEQAGTNLSSVFAGVGTLTPRTSARERFEHAPNRGYSFSSPLADPWFAARAVRNGTPSAAVNEAFNLPVKAAVSGGERLEVELWGGLDYPETPDHSVRILLNGNEVARSRFDGVNRNLVTAVLSPGVLQSGANTLSLELLGDTGLVTDVVYLEAIRIDYDRALVAVDDRLLFNAATTAPDSTGSGDTVFADDFSDEGVAACRSSDSSCVAYTVSGLSRADLAVLRVRAGAAQRLTGTRLSGSAGDYQVSFASGLRAGDRFMVEPLDGGAAVELTPALAVTDPLAGGPASYLIISHPSFSSGLAPLIAARQAEGFSVRVLSVEDLYRHYSGGVVDPTAIQRALADAYSRLGTRYVLLVGGDTYDYFNDAGTGSISFVPTVYRPVGAVVRYTPADSVYADVDGDGRSDLALGRLPVRTLAELDAVVAKTLSYAQAGHARKALLLSDREQNSVSFREGLVPLDERLGESWTSTTISLQNYPAGAAGTSQARGDLVAALNAGQALLSYFGHSAPSSWTREALVNASLVYGGLFNGNPPTAVWQLGCWGAYFVEPTYNTVAHGLMLQSGGGAAAVLGASALTETASDSAWINVLGGQLAGRRIGEALRDAQRVLHDQSGELLDISVGGTLLGDPALLLRE